MHIDVFHDTACPWCRIGKKNLFDALEAWDGLPVSLAFRTFFLNPNVPEGGVDFATYMNDTKGVPLESMFEGPRRMGEEAGLTFNFEALSIAPNTVLSHRMIALTPDEKTLGVIDAIYAAYFEHGRNISTLETLLTIAEEQGLDVDAMRTQLESDAALERVMTEYQQAQQIGITGVPAFVVGQKYLVTGAQPPEFWRQALPQMQAELAATE